MVAMMVTWFHGGHIICDYFVEKQASTERFFVYFRRQHSAKRWMDVVVGGVAVVCWFAVTCKFRCDLWSKFLCSKNADVGTRITT